MSKFPCSVRESTLGAIVIDVYVEHLVAVPARRLGGGGLLVRMWLGRRHGPWGSARHDMVLAGRRGSHRDEGDECKRADMV